MALLAVGKKKITHSRNRGGGRAIPGKGPGKSWACRLRDYGSKAGRNRSVWVYLAINTSRPGLRLSPPPHLLVNSFSLLSIASATHGISFSECQLHEAHGGLSGFNIVRFKRQLRTFSQPYSFFLPNALSNNLVELLLLHRALESQRDRRSPCQDIQRAN